MLSLLRKYQRIIFIFVACFVAIAFSFTGSYLGGGGGRGGAAKQEDPVVFTAIDGSKIKRSELNQMMVFIGSDTIDKLQLGGIPGPNFLNDGVVRRDLLSSGLASVLATTYFDQLAEELHLKAQKERHYQPYVHPSVPFISAQATWEQYAPSLMHHYNELMRTSQEPTPEQFSNRVALFLAEGRFPQPMLKQVIRYQESQYNWIPADSHLGRDDLSLFGYHTVEDWFGHRFLALSAEFLIDASILAQEHGYSVSDAEVWTELKRNAELSYMQMKGTSYVTAADSQGYLQQQLDRMQMDQKSAVKNWKRVMLFRRLFDEVGHTALVDLLPYQKFSEYASESVELDLYRMPDSLHLADFSQLQAFETYLDLAYKRDVLDPLALPTTPRPVATVKREAPELVERRYLLQVRQVNKEALALKVPLKQVWAWELEAENWQQIADRYPALATAGAKTKEARFAALERLDSETRHTIDGIAQNAIVDAHPDWVEEALAASPIREIEIGVTADNRAPLPGVTDRAGFIAKLNAAPIGVDATEGSNLWSYTDDDQVYYRISLLDRDEEEHILTFAEAMRLRALPELVDRRLGDQSPDTLFARIQRKVFDAAPRDLRPAQPDGDFAANYRFYSHLQRVEKEIQEKGEASGWISATEVAELGMQKLPPLPNLEQQWNVEKEVVTVRRSANARYGEVAYNLPTGSWSAPTGTEFFHVASHTPGSLVQQQGMRQGKGELALEAQLFLMEGVLAEIDERAPLEVSGMFPQDRAHDPTS